MGDRVVAELVYPGQTNDLHMTVTAEDPQRDGKMFIVPVEVVIPIEKITFVRSQSGTYKARVSLHYATAVNQKDFVSYGRRQIIELVDSHTPSETIATLHPPSPSPGNIASPSAHGRHLQCVVVTDGSGEDAVGGSAQLHSYTAVELHSCTRAVIESASSPSTSRGCSPRERPS